MGADRDRVEPLQQPQLRQLLDGMRQGVDADAELADAIGLLEQLAIDAAGMQHQRRGEPPDTAADDDDLHGLYAFAHEAKTFAIMSVRGRTSINSGPLG